MAGFPSLDATLFSLRETAPKHTACALFLIPPRKTTPTTAHPSPRGRVLSAGAPFLSPGRDPPGRTCRSRPSNAPKRTFPPPPGPSSPQEGPVPPRGSAGPFRASPVPPREAAVPPEERPREAVPRQAPSGSSGAHASFPPESRGEALRENRHRAFPRQSGGSPPRRRRLGGRPPGGPPRSRAHAAGQRSCRFPGAAPLPTHHFAPKQPGRTILRKGAVRDGFEPPRGSCRKERLRPLPREDLPRGIPPLPRDSRGELPPREEIPPHQVERDGVPFRMPRPFPEERTKERPGAAATLQDARGKNRHAPGIPGSIATQRFSPKKRPPGPSFPACASSSVLPRHPSPQKRQGEKRLFQRAAVLRSFYHRHRSFSDRFARLRPLPVLSGPPEPTRRKEIREEVFCFREQTSVVPQRKTLFLFSRFLHNQS